MLSDPACDICLFSANVQKMNAQSRGRLKQRQKSEHRPAFDQADRDYDPVTPCASGRAPDPSGKLKTQLKVSTIKFIFTFIYLLLTLL